MKRPSTWMWSAATLLALAACGEKPQENGAQQLGGQPAFDGTGVAAFTAPDWKAGDANSWQQQLRTRGQYGQNDYTRMLKP